MQGYHNWVRAHARAHTWDELHCTLILVTWYRGNICMGWLKGSEVQIRILVLLLAFAPWLVYIPKTWLESAMGIC